MRFIGQSRRWHCALLACAADAQGQLPAPVGCAPVGPYLPDVGRYEELLAAKVSRVQELLHHRLRDVELEVFPSKPLHYRMKASFTIRHDGDDLQFCVEDPANKRALTPLEEFPIACERINELMPRLRSAMKQDANLRRSAFSVEMLANTDNEALVCLFYHRVLDDANYATVAASLAAALGVTFIGRSRKKRIVAGPGRLVQRYDVAGRTFPQIHQELMFSQANPSICQEMLRWAEKQTRPSPGVAPTTDLLELHCGNGNFTLPLAANFRRVLATESVRTPLRFAEESAKEAGVTNVSFARLSSQEVEKALRGTRTFRRLTDAGLALEDFDLDIMGAGSAGTVLVDPPRCGLDAGGQAVLGHARRGIYISCNPESLATDLENMPEHHVTAAALFDQFPFTDHAEVGVVLEKA